MHLGCHPPKDASFDILSLADQLYRSRLTNPNGSEPRKIYFSENLVPDLLVQGEKALIKNVLAYNKSLSKPGGGREVIGDKLTEEVEVEDKTGFQELQGINERVNEIFNQARESEFAASDFMT